MKKYIFVLCISAFLIGMFLFKITPYKEVVTSEGMIPLFTKSEMVDFADVIIRGQVVKYKESKWSNQDSKRGENVPNIIQTDILIKIKEVYKGLPYDEKVIAVRVDKGAIENTEYRDDSYPDFDKNEEVVLFLSLDDGLLADLSEEYYVLTGLKQGKISLTQNKAHSKVFKSLEKDEIALNDVVNEINEEIEFLKKNPLNKMTKEELEQHNKEVFGE